MINKLIQETHQIAVDHGFHEDEKNIGEMLALVHSEVSEALEADRHDLFFTGDIEKINAIESDEQFKLKFVKSIKSTFDDELADVVIRVFDIAFVKNVNLQEHIKAKMRFNSLREYKHGGKKY